ASGCRLPSRANRHQSRPARHRRSDGGFPHRTPLMPGTIVASAKRLPRCRTRNRVRLPPCRSCSFPFLEVFHEPLSLLQLARRERVALALVGILAGAELDADRRAEQAAAFAVEILERAPVRVGHALG